MPAQYILLSNLKKKLMKRLAEQSAAAAKPVDSTPNVCEVKTEVIDVSEAVGSPTTNKDGNNVNGNTQNKRPTEVVDGPPIKDEPMEVDETVPVAGPSREICLNENELKVIEVVFSQAFPCPDPKAMQRRPVRRLPNDNDVITDRINHMKFQLSCERYLCVACKAVHVKLSDAVLHQFQDYRVKGLRYSLMCPICRSIFSDLTLFYAHMVTDRRHTKLTFRSDWCNFSFCTKKEAEQHNKEHSMAASQLNMSCGVNCCGICGTAKDYWFARLDNRTFIDHTVFHGFRTSTVCRICSARFDVDKLAFRHYADIHLRDDTSHQANAEEGRKYCRTCRRSLSVDMACDHFDAVHKFVMIEFVPELDNELVIFASRELQCRFNL